MLDIDIAYDHEQYERDRQELDRPTHLISNLGPNVCQECGSACEMYQARRSEAIFYPLDDGEVAYRHRSDPFDANYVWLPCQTCRQMNLDGFHAMIGGEYTNWFNESSSVWDDRPERPH